MNKENKFQVCPWIAWKTYVLDNYQKTLIFEQRSQVYYLLDNEASICWERLCGNDIISQENMQTLQTLIIDGVIQIAFDAETVCDSYHVEKYTQIPCDFSENIKRYGYIFDVHWDITNKCNARCIHCYNPHAHDGTRNIVSDELSYDEAIQLVNELDYLGVFRIVLSGGEAMTKEFFFELCQHIRKRHMQLVIYTNGLALTQVALSKLVEVYPATVCFSVYGDSDFVHDGITRITGSYSMVLNALSFLKEHGVYTCHKNTLLKPNCSRWRETLIKGRDLADSSLVNCTLYPSMDDKLMTEYSLDESQLLDLALSPDSPIYYKRKIVGACNIFKDTDRTPCYDATSNIYINPVGEVYPCIAFPYVLASFRDGNVRDLKRCCIVDAFDSDIDSISGVKRLDNWRALKVSDLKECNTYDYCKFCIDVCPGDAYLLTNDLLKAPENHCAIAKARHKAFLLNQN